MALQQECKRIITSKLIHLWHDVVGASGESHLAAAAEPAADSADLDIFAAHVVPAGGVAGIFLQPAKDVGSQRLMPGD